MVLTPLTPMTSLLPVRLTRPGEGRHAAEAVCEPAQDHRGPALRIRHHPWLAAALTGALTVTLTPGGGSGGGSGGDSGCLLWLQLHLRLWLQLRLCRVKSTVFLARSWSGQTLAVSDDLATSVIEKL